MTDTSSADCAPNQLFQLFRCSAWLILQKQSTGLFLPKRSCSRAAPLRRRTELPFRESPVFRSASSDYAPNQPFRLLRCFAWLILHEQFTGLFILKRSCFRAAPLRGSVHRTVYSETLDLQGYAPPGAPSRGSLKMHTAVFLRIIIDSRCSHIILRKAC